MGGHAKIVIFQPTHASLKRLCPHSWGPIWGKYENYAKHEFRKCFKTKYY